MTQNHFPEGRDEERVQAVIAHYDNQTEEEAIAEEESMGRPSETSLNGAAER